MRRLVLLLALSGCDLQVRGGTLEQRLLETLPPGPSLERARRCERERAAIPELPDPVGRHVRAVARERAREELSAAREACRDDPKNPEGWLRVARLLMAEGRWSEARAACRAGLAWGDSRALGKLEATCREEERR